MGLLSALLFAGCGDPCSDLAKKICGCEPTDIEQQTCTQGVNDSSRPAASDAQQDVCAELLDSCTCKKLAAGELAACGLAEE